jgi:hypothetical protein
MATRSPLPGWVSRRRSQHVELRPPLRCGEPGGQPGLGRGRCGLEFFQGADPVDQHCTIGPGRQIAHGGARRFPLFSKRFRRHQQQVVVVPVATTCS